MAVQITAAQVKQQLSALGYSVPDFMIDAYLCKLGSISMCLEAAGYDECDLMLIQVYAVTLMARVDRRREGSEEHHLDRVRTGRYW